MPGTRLWLDIAGIGLVLFASGVTLLGLRDTPLYVDEETHAVQIEQLIDLQPVIAADLAVIPGYHVTVAAVAALLQVRGLNGLRAISAFLALLGVSGFAVAAARLAPRWWRTTTLQFVSLPLLFPFFFLVYTDALSAALVFLMLALVLADRPSLAGLAALAAVLVRQNNILWAGFAAMLYCVERWGYRPSLASCRLALRRLWTFVGLAVLFLAFVAGNRGIALRDKDQHPLSLHSGNVFFTLFVVAIILLPLHVANARRILRLLRGHPGVWMLLGLGFVVFQLTFRHDHPCNDPNATVLDIPSMSNLREIALVYFSSSLALRTAFFVVAALALLSLWVTPLWRRSGYLLYPFSAVFLATNWLIEQRYAIIPVALLLLLRRRRSPALEATILAQFVLLSAFITYGIATGLYGY